MDAQNIFLTRMVFGGLPPTFTTSIVWEENGFIDPSGWPEQIISYKKYIFLPWSLEIEWSARVQVAAK